MQAFDVVVVVVVVVVVDVVGVAGAISLPREITLGYLSWLNEFY